MNNISLSDSPKHIKGISCCVKDCIHHDVDDYCTAKSISVGPYNASCCSETVCATFKKKCNDNCAPNSYK